jgi:hypothetical protein
MRRDLANASARLSRSSAQSEGFIAAQIEGFSACGPATPQEFAARRDRSWQSARPTPVPEARRIHHRATVSRGYHLLGTSQCTDAFEPIVGNVSWCCIKTAN